MGLIDHEPQNFCHLVQLMTAAENLDVDYLVRRYCDADGKPQWEFHTPAIPSLQEVDHILNPKESW